MVVLSRSLPVASLLWAPALASTAASPGEVAPEAWVADDGTCNGSSGEDCGVSLRQLRVRELPAQKATSEPSETSAPDDSFTTNGLPDDKWPEGLPIPGGWGEGANYVEDMEEHELSHTPGVTSMAGGQNASCERYGCLQSSMSQLSCQCHPGCQEAGNCCEDYTAQCAEVDSFNASDSLQPQGRNIRTLYHQTGRSIGPLILRNGFRPGHSGWCGGAIYFATSPQATNGKAIGPDSHKGFMIQAVVDVGRILYRNSHCGPHVSSHKLAAMGYDSIVFNPGDGDEYVVYNSHRILSTKEVPMNGGGGGSRRRRRRRRHY